ncbi:DNA-binding response regulator [bacterium D16-76]|nr:DNA-binding response regulator [bacterium D16-76]
MTYKIFLVEDDPVIAQAVAAHLTMWGYEVRPAQDLRRVAEEFAAFEPHLVLLDIGLPHRSGYDWCRDIRRRSKVPVVFLSSASENMDIITAMNLGGDDFIPKPFDLSVLTAKVQAVLRRAYDFGLGANRLAWGGAQVDLGTSVLHGPQGQCELTRNELRIAQVLMESGGHLVTRQDLMARLWEDESFVDDNTLTVNVSRLRRKLEQVGLRGLLATRKGLGYQLGQGGGEPK